MRQNRTVDPTTEPLTLAEVKAHLRIEEGDDTEDLYLLRLIQSAREYVEDYCGIALLPQTWQLTSDGFPCEFRLRPPVQSVSSVSYVDAVGSTDTVASSVYRLDSKSWPGRLTTDYSQTWPTPLSTTNAVTVTYVTGYSAATSIPARLVQAMLMHIADQYEFRETDIIGTIHTNTGAIERALFPYRVPLT